MSTLEVPKATVPCRLAELGLAAEGALRMAPMCRLPEILEAHGLDSAAEIREVGCDPALFTDPENTIDFAAVGRLLNHAALVTGNPYPGLELGRPLGLDVLGTLGSVLRLAPDLGTALRTLIRYFHLHDRGAVPSLWDSAGRAMFGYTLCYPGVPGTDHIYDAAMAIAHNVFSELTGKAWKYNEIRLFRDPPEDTEPFSRHFHTRVRFRAEHAALVFPAADLLRPLPGTNRDAYAEGLRQLEEMEKGSDAVLFAVQVRRMLRQVLISPPGPHSADLQGIAQLLAIHPRTLSRRLSGEGTTFSKLLAETRYALAQQLLRDTNLQTVEIALILGYAESASFDHAFRRWSGSTASRWRASNRVE